MSTTFATNQPIRTCCNVNVALSVGYLMSNTDKTSTGNACSCLFLSSFFFEIALWIILLVKKVYLHWLCRAVIKFYHMCEHCFKGSCQWIMLHCKSSQHLHVYSHIFSLLFFCFVLFFTSSDSFMTWAIFGAKRKNDEDKLHNLLRWCRLVAAA